MHRLRLAKCWMKLMNARLHLITKGYYPSAPCLKNKCWPAARKRKECYTAQRDYVLRMVLRLRLNIVGLPFLLIKWLTVQIALLLLDLPAAHTDSLR